MAYIGTKPADKPLTAADITDSIITSAKIVDATIANADIANATIALAKLSATGTPSASTFLRGDNSWVAAGETNTPIFALRKAANQTTSANTSTLITWSNADIDTDSGFNDANDSWTVPTGKGGKYYLTLACGFTYGTRIILYIYKNGSTVLELDTNYPDNYSNPILNSTISLSAGDVLTTYFYTVSASGTLRFQNDTGNYVTRFEGFRISS
jgi:hypothetical protein